MSTHSRASSMDFRSEAVDSRSEIAFVPATDGSLRLQPDSTIHFDEDSRVDDTAEVDIASSGDGTPRSPQFVTEKLPEDDAAAPREGSGRATSAESFTRSDAAKNISASPPPKSLPTIHEATDDALHQEQDLDQHVASPSPSKGATGALQGRTSPRSEHSIAISGTETSVNFFQMDDDEDSLMHSPHRTPPPQPPAPNVVSSPIADAAAVSPPGQATSKRTPPSRRPPSTKPLSPASPKREIVIKAPPALEAPTSPLGLRRSASTTQDIKVAARPVEHSQSWDASPAAKPHHALYQPSQLQKIEEEEFAKNFPYWNKPKGVSSGKQYSTDGDIKPAGGPNRGVADSTAVAAAPDVVPAVATSKTSIHPVDDLRSKAKEFSDRLRREHRDATRTDASMNSSTTFGHHHDSSIAFEALESINAGAPQPEEAEVLAESRTSRRSGSGHQSSPERQETVKSWLHGVSADESRLAAVSPPPPIAVLDRLPSPPHRKSSFQEYAEVNLSPRSSASDDERAARNAKQRTVAKPQEFGRTSAPREDRSAASHRSNAIAHPEQRRPSTPGRQSTPSRRGSIASAPNDKTHTTVPAAPMSTEQLEAKRRKFYLIYGQRKGQEYFERFLEERHLSDPNPPQAARRGSAPRQRNATPQSRRASPSANPNDERGRDPEQQHPTPRRSAWDRLYSTKIHHPTHSPTREALHLPSPTDPESNDSATRKRAATPPDPRVFTKLYQIGLDEKARREKMFVDGQRKKVEKELAEAVDAVVLAKILRSTAGHKSMTKDELEAVLRKERQRYLDALSPRSKSEHDRALGSQPASRSGTPGSHVGGSRPPTPRSRQPSPNRALDHVQLNLSAEPQLTQDGIDEMTTRLFKLGRRKFADEAKLKADREIAGCTFTPRINGRSSTPVRRSSTPNTRSNSQVGPTQPRPANRSATPDRCKALYSYSQRERSNQDANRDRVIREQKMKILKGKLESDHHFKRRVAADPSLAEKFMASIRCV